MGRWSRAAGAVFLSWLTPPSGARWLDVGCGTGVFTELVLDTCEPSSMVAVDPALAQIELSACDALDTACSVAAVPLLEAGELLPEGEEADPEQVAMLLRLLLEKALGG